MMTEAEFDQAAERYLNMVYRIALNWFGSVPDAEDATQEVMLRLWKSGPPPGEGEDRLRYWLARVSVNVCKDLSRTPGRLHPVSLEETPELLAPEAEDRQVLEEVLRLPKKYRVPLYLYHYEGYSAAEVGALMGLNVSTVRTRLERARRKLKQQLEEG